MLALADRLDQAILVALFVFLCLRLLPGGFSPDRWYALMLIVSEGIALFFVMIRRPTERITLDPGDWAIAVGGTVSVLLVENHGQPFWPKLGFVLIFVGFVIHFGAKLSLRRSFGIVPADRGIKSNAFYSLVRHPMYFGYTVSHVGFLLAVPSLWNAVVYSIAWTCFLARITREERVLSRNADYVAYAARVRYRLVPGLY
jgi:protein-S-isoprenylcysteine O-methyltransferase Ste14